MQQLFANNAHSTLAHNISKEQTSITLADASHFPEITPDSGDYYLATLLGRNGSEIIKITHKEGNTLTTERGWEATPAQAWPANTPIEMRPTAATLRKVPQSIDKFEVGDILHAITAPSASWLPADGSLHPVAQYPQLAKLLPTVLPSGYFNTYSLHTTANTAGSVQNICFSSTGKYFGIGMVSSPYFRGYKFNQETGRLQEITDFKTGSIPKSKVYCVCFYEDDEKESFYCCNSDFYNLYLDKPPAVLGNKEGVSSSASSYIDSLNISKNNRYLALGRQSGSHIDMYRNTKKFGWQRISGLQGIPSAVYKIIFTPDGRFIILLLGSSPYLRVYEVRKNGGNSYWSAPSALGNGANSDIALSPNGKYLAIAHARKPYLTIASVNNGKISALAELSADIIPEGAGNAVAFSPDGQYLAVGNTRSSSSKASLVLYQFNQENGSILQKLPSSYQLTGSQNGGFLAFSPNGKYLAFGSTTASESVKILKAGNTSYTAQFRVPLISTAGTGLQAYIKAK